MHSENNKMINQNANITQVKQEEKMQQTNEVFSDNAVVLQQEHRLVEQTVIENEYNIINDDEDEVSKTKKEDGAYFSLPIENNVVQSDTKQIENIGDEKFKNQSTKTSSEEMPTPARIIADYVFLLGRLTTQVITNYEGNIIIPKNTLITAKIVLLAFENGRLLELTKHSKS